MHISYNKAFQGQLQEFFFALPHIFKHAKTAIILNRNASASHGILYPTEVRP